MSKNYEDLNLLKFQAKYKTEEDCRQKLRELKWPNGFECPRCKSKEYYDLPKRNLYQCKECGYQASVTAGTVMQGTRTPLLKWFWAIFLVSNDKRGISALALSKRIEVSYWISWTMLQKIRKAMRDRDSHYKLSGIIEMDDAFFGGPKEGGNKRGRGSSKIPVIVEASTDGEGVGYVRMTVVDKIDSDTVKEVVETDVRASQTIKSDGYSPYNAVKESGHKHQKEVVKGKKAHEVLKWVHILTSNAKAYILGTFHGVDRKHLQAYLDEFCYRLNRRWTEGQLFDRLVTACVASNGIKFSELTQ